MKAKPLIKTDTIQTRSCDTLKTAGLITNQQLNLPSGNGGTIL